jgi:hypothetical protein
MGTSTIGTPTTETPTMTAMDISSVAGKGQQCIEVMGEEFMTSEAMENDMVSGIEIAPSKSCGESVSTASTHPLSTDSSESWSLSSTSLVDARTDTSDDSEEDENDQAPYLRTPLFCNAGSSMESLVGAEGVCNPAYGRRRIEKPRKQRATNLPAAMRRCDVQEERTRVEMILVVRLENNVSLNSEEQSIVNTVENQPDRLLSSVISKSTSLLCMMSLIPVDRLSQLFDMQNRMEGCFLSILAFHDGIPALVGNDPLALNGNHFSIPLDDWLRNRKTIKKSETDTETEKDSPVALKPKRNMQIEVEDECRNFVCNPGLLPLMTSPRTANDETDLLCDEELRAVMKITQNGNDTSALFPCFSVGSDSYSCESDDGLKDEMGALDRLQNELQIELETAEETIKELETAKVTIDGTEAIAIGTGKKSIGKLPLLRRRRYQKPLSSPTLPPPRSKRRVRFSKTHTEHIFISEIASISDESAEDYGCEFHLDEYTYVIEDAVEELTSLFVQRLQYFRPRQPKDRVATRSNTHYF